MRIEPENSTVVEEFELENELEDVWDMEFPVKKGDHIKARHMNALWAALTERGRLVGIEVHDWAAIFPPTVSGATPTSDSTPTWSWVSRGGDGNGNFRHKLDDPNLESGATETMDTSFKPTAPLSEAPHTLYVQEQNGSGDWSTSGSFEITIDFGVPIPPEHVPEEPEEPEEKTQWNRPVKGMVRPEDLLYWDGFDGTEADQIGTQKILDLLIKIDEVCQRYVNPDEGRGFLGLGDMMAYLKIGESVNPESYWEQDDISNSDHTYDSWGFPVIPDRPDEVLYERYKKSTKTLEDIFFNDPRFSAGGHAEVEDFGGGYGEAQYEEWEYNGNPQFPGSVTVKVKDSEDVTVRATPMCHEHINVCYYLIRALEWTPYKTSDTTTDFEEITVQSPGAKFGVISPNFCLPTDPAQKEQWVKFTQQVIGLPLSEVSTFVGSSATLFGWAIQETWYNCPLVGPIDPFVWVLLNLKEARFSSYIPRYASFEDAEFPGGPTAYKVDLMKVWADHSHFSQARRSDESFVTPGWGGTASLKIMDGPIAPLTSIQAFLDGEELLSIPITSLLNFTSVIVGNDVDVKSVNFPNTLSGLKQETIDEQVTFNLHFDIDVGNMRTFRSPNNEIPEENSIDSQTNQNYTESQILADVLCATKFEDHTYTGGKVDVGEMEL